MFRCCYTSSTHLCRMHHMQLLHDGGRCCEPLHARTQTLVFMMATSSLVGRAVAWGEAGQKRAKLTSPKTKAHSDSHAVPAPACCSHACHGAANRPCMGLWKCCHKPDCHPPKGRGVWQPYITSRAAAAPLFRSPSAERRQRCSCAEPPGLQLPWAAEPPPGSPALLPTVAPSQPPPTLLLSTYRQTATTQNVRQRARWRQPPVKVKVLLKGKCAVRAPPVVPASVTSLHVTATF